MVRIIFIRASLEGEPCQPVENISDRAGENKLSTTIE
jgi:hypothetical protein